MKPELWALLPQDIVVRLLASMHEALGPSITQMLPAAPAASPSHKFTAAADGHVNALCCACQPAAKATQWQQMTGNCRLQSMPTY